MKMAPNVDSVSHHILCVYFIIFSQIKIVFIKVFFYRHQNERHQYCLLKMAPNLGLLYFSIPISKIIGEIQELQKNIYALQKQRKNV